MASKVAASIPPNTEVPNETRLAAPAPVATTKGVRPTIVEKEVRERFRGSPIKRAKRVGLQRNVCVALGNIGDASAVPALAKALVTAEPLVRSHAAWALGRLGGRESEAALESALASEADVEVREEIELALAECPRTVPSR